MQGGGGSRRWRHLRIVLAVVAAIALMVGGYTVVSAAPNSGTGSLGSLGGGGGGTPPTTTTPPSTTTSAPPTTTTPPVSEEDPTTPAAETVEVPADEVTSVAGDQAGAHTVTIAPGGEVPEVGGFLAAPISPEAPRGVLGKVTGIVVNPDGSTTVSLVPARLDEAFDQVNIVTATTLDDATIIPAEEVDPEEGPSARGIGKEFKVNASLGLLTCDTNLATKINYALKLTDLKVDFELNTWARKMKLVVTYSPQFTASLKASGAVSCSLKELAKPRVLVPVSAMPPLAVEIKPEFTGSLEGSFSASVAWGPTIKAGFKVDGSGVTPIGSASCCGDIDTGTFSASAEAFMGVSGGLSIAGLASGGFDFGPRLTWTPENNCSTIDVDLAVKAKLDTIVDGWNVRLNTAALPLGKVSNECTEVPVVTNRVTCEPSGDTVLLRFPDLGPGYKYRLIPEIILPTVDIAPEALVKDGPQFAYRVPSDLINIIVSMRFTVSAYEPDSGTSVRLGWARAVRAGGLGKCTFG